MVLHSTDRFLFGPTVGCCSLVWSLGDLFVGSFLILDFDGDPPFRSRLRFVFSFISFTFGHVHCSFYVRLHDFVYVI